MRFLFLAFLLLLPSDAFAQSRVVGDTFAESRASHLQSSQDALRQYQEDGAVIMKERTAAAEEVEAQRIEHREALDESEKQWTEDWNNAADQRRANSAAVEAAREDRRAASLAAPAQWWGMDESGDDIHAGDYDDLNQ